MYRMDKWIVGCLKILYEMRRLLSAKMYELTLERGGGKGSWFISRQQHGIGMDRLDNSSQCTEQDSKHVPRKSEAQQLQQTSSLYLQTKPHGNATAAHNRAVRRGYIDDNV